MKQKFSKISGNTTIGTTFVIIIGLILTFFPNVVADTIFYILGITCLITAGVYLYKCLNTFKKVINASTCVAFLALGLIFIIFQSGIFSALNLTAGICLLVSGAFKFYTAFSFYKSSPVLFKKLLIPAVINVLLGILLILIRDTADDVIIRIIGVVMLYFACENIITKLLIRIDEKNSLSKELEQTGIQTEFTDDSTDTE